MQGWRGRALQFEQLEVRRMLTTGPIISEFLASNDTTLDDGDGNSSDWIEIYNPTADTIDLTGWHLTDRDDNLDKWTFPGAPHVSQSVLDLDPGEFLVVFASGQNTDDYIDAGGNLHTNFRLSIGGEYLAIVQPDGVTIEHAYAPDFPAQTTDIAYGLAFDNSTTNLIAEGAAASYLVPSGPVAGWNNLSFDDSGWSSGDTGIGYENSPADYADHIETAVPSGTRTLYLRQEFEVTDLDSLDGLTLQMRYDDGFLAYLNGHLVAAQNEPLNPQWNSIAAGGHDDSDAVRFEPFDLSDHRDKLVPGNNVLAIQALNLGSSSDMLIEAALDSRQGSLIMPLDAGILPLPSPGKINGDTFQGLVQETTVSVDRGFFDAPIDVAITTPTAGATLVYTTDGSEPSLSNGIQILPIDEITPPQTTINIAATTVLRTAAFKEDLFPGDTATYTYVFVEDVINSPVMDTAITADPEYAPLMQQALLDIPSVSLVFETEINNSTPEQKASVEWLSPAGGAEFQVDAGIHAFGGEFTNFAKKNFRLHFRGEYGTPKLNFPLFAGFDRGLPVTETFDQLNFRSGSHDMSMRGFYMSNRFTDDTMLDMGNLASHGRFVHLYLNGTYWGQFHMRERWNADMLAEYFGGSDDDYEAINGNRNVGGWSPGEVYDGDGSGWEHIKSLAGDYEANRQHLNIANYLDFMLLYMSGNSENEYRTGGTTDGAVPYHFFLNDADGWLRTVGDRTGDPGPGNIFSGLLAEAHPDFITLLADRIQALFFNEGALTAEKSVARLQERLDEIQLSFLAESARWGFRTPASWESAASNAINNILPAIPQTMFNRLRARGLFSAVDTPSFNQHGGNVPSGFQLEISSNTLPPSDSLAFGRPATQSSTGFGFPADIAVNGVTSDFTHTATGDLNPYLEVNLQGEAFIESLVIHNRDNCCQNRLYNISVEIRGADDQVVYASPLFNPVAEGQSPTSPGETITLDLTGQPGGGIHGQFIRVNKLAVNGSNSSEWLSLGELEVFGESLDGPMSTGTYYTLDGSDPRLPGGTVNPVAILYDGTPIALTADIKVRTRSLQGATWSALNEAQFIVATPADFDADGNIDQVDLNLWEEGFGTAQGASPSSGDADADGTVNGHDFLIWQRNYNGNIAALGQPLEPGAIEASLQGEYDSATHAVQPNFTTTVDELKTSNSLESRPPHSIAEVAAAHSIQRRSLISQAWDAYSLAEFVHDDVATSRYLSNSLHSLPENTSSTDLSNDDMLLAIGNETETAARVEELVAFDRYFDHWTDTLRWRE